MPDEDAPPAPAATEAQPSTEPTWDRRLREALVDAARARIERQRCMGRDPHA